jgi:hypothetical protein
MTAELERLPSTVLTGTVVPPVPTFPQLDPEQEAGEACVVCWASFDGLDNDFDEGDEIEPGEPDMRGAVWVGLSRFGQRVFACPQPCARQLGFRPEAGWQDGRV